MVQKIAFLPLNLPLARTKAAIEDIIIYKSKTGQMKGKFIVHRITEKHDDYLIVKGDNNVIDDSEQITADMIYGVI